MLLDCANNLGAGAGADGTGETVV